MGIIGAERINGVGDGNDCGNDGDGISGGAAAAANDDAHAGCVGDGGDNIVKVMTLLMAMMIW